MMRTRLLAARSVKIFAVPLLLAGMVAGMASVTPAVAAQTRLAAPRVSIPYPGQLNGAAVTTAGTAWAVGYTSGEALTERWNGKSWTWASALEVAPDGDFYSVAAISASNAWAVGYIPSASATVSLIAHWNGKAWKRVRSPNPGPGGTLLSGVAAVSADNIWAVGQTGLQKTVILHWNGKAWTRVSSPSPGTYDQLFGVAASSASNAWAVGQTQNGSGIHTLVLHWNGKAWTQVHSPSPGPMGDKLYGVTVTSASNAWAVGYSTVYSEGWKTLILHWNGKAWTQVPSPDPVTVSSSKLTWNVLQGVAATSVSNAWAVGYDETNLLGSKTMILHWNGKAWKQVASPNPFCATCDTLYGVASASARSAWAVGTVNTGGEVVILHWNGTRWVNSTSANVLG
jgi:hypothetical protein